MSQLNTVALTKLATVSSVNMNSASAQTLFVVPAGLSCIISHVVVRNASISLNTASYSFGFTGPAYNDVITGATHTELTGPTLYTILTAKVGAKLGSASAVFSVIMNILQGAPATTTMDVYGYLF